MKRVIVLIALILTMTCAALAQVAPAAGRRPQFQNAQVEMRSAASGLEAAVAAAVREQGARTFWLGYEAPTPASERMMCCFNSVDDANRKCCGGCRLEGERGGITINGTQNKDCKFDRPEFSNFFVMARFTEGRLAKVRSFSPDCTLDAVNTLVVWLTDVNPAQSIQWLRQQITRTDKKVDTSALHAIAIHDHPLADTVLEQLMAPGNDLKIRKDAAFWLGHERGRRGYEAVRKLAFSDAEDRFREHLTFVLSQSREKDAIDDVIRMAKQDTSDRVRGQALFWLAQKASRKAADAITDAMENDPELAVKKKAVFALGQMRDDEGLNKLIQVAQSHPNRVLRKEAIFWLGQSKDPRALDFIVKFVEGK